MKTKTVKTIKASSLQVGMYLNRFGNRCHVISTEPYTHVLGVPAIRVKHTNGFSIGELSYAPNSDVKIFVCPICGSETHPVRCCAQDGN